MTLRTTELKALSDCWSDIHGTYAYFATFHMKQVAKVSTSWSKAETLTLLWELNRFAGGGNPDVPYTTKCLKIAAMLPNKLTRDVANRIRQLDEAPRLESAKSLPLLLPTGESQRFNRENARGISQYFNDHGNCKLQNYQSRRDLFTMNDELILNAEKLLAAGHAEQSKETLAKILCNLLQMNLTLQRRGSMYTKMPRMPVEVDARVANLVVHYCSSVTHSLNRKA
jgi:hypothetical protein